MQHGKMDTKKEKDRKEEEEENRGTITDNVEWGILEDSEKHQYWIEVAMVLPEPEAHRRIVGYLYESQMDEVAILRKMCDDYIAIVEAKAEGDAENDIDAILTKVEKGVGGSLQFLLQQKAKGVRFEQAIWDTCLQWNLTRHQAKSVLALCMASLKLFESEIIPSDAPSDPPKEEFRGYA